MRLSQKRDVDALYILLLGRRPENAQVCREYFDRSVREAADAIVGSEEFTEIVDDFRRHGTLPHARLGAEVLRSALGIAVEIGLAPADGEDQPEEPDRFAALARIFAAEPLCPLIALRHGEAGRAFVERLRALYRARPAPAEIARTPGKPNAELLISLDSPDLPDGAVALAAQSSLWVSGWAIARDGSAAIDVFIDGVGFGPVIRGLARPDVAAGFPDWPDAGHSGFTMLIPRRKLPKGRHAVKIAFGDTSGGTRVIEFFVDVAESVADPLSIRRKIAQSEIDLYLHLLAKRDWRPAFRLLLLLGGEDGEIERARATLSSLSRQAYGDWRLLVAARRRSAGVDSLREQLMGGAETVGTLLARLHDGRADPRVLRERLLAGFADIAERVEILRSGDRRSLAELAGSGPALFGLLAAGDELSVDALLEFAVTSALDRDADFLYGDEWRVSPVSGEAEPFLKPQWSPDLLLSTNYIGRPWCVAPRLLARTGATLAELLGLGEYDLVLRLTEAAAHIRHVPGLLCQRGRQRLDSAAAEREALARALARRGIAGAVAQGCAPGTYRVQRALTRPGLVSIIIPSCAAPDRVGQCIESLRAVTAYRNFEIVCIDDIPEEAPHAKSWLWSAADKTVEIDAALDWATRSNLAAEAAAGEFLLFFHAGNRVAEPDWLDALLEHAQRPEVGAVGPRLLDGKRRVRQAGMFLAPDTGRPTAAFCHAGAGDPGYFGLALTQRNVIAVSGDCLLTRRAVFERLGGFDEGAVNNDIDYCLRAWRSGLLTVFTPYATLAHQACGGAESDAHDCDGRWRDLAGDGDPYHHRSLAPDASRIAPEAEPVRVICPAAPLLAREAIRSILVVKLDHIGDGITAFPAIRRLKEHFPDAALRLLAGRWTRPIWEFAGVIDEVIEFDFFHARSSLGLRGVTADELAALRERLAPYRFDLAVDLRKHPETRPILQQTGARYLAGFDHDRQFPWLDVALDWTADRPMTPRPQPVRQGLISLVDAIVASCEPGSLTIAVPQTRLLPLPDAMQRRLFARPLVCLHPAAGDTMRQWPPEHFAELADLLIEKEAVNVALIGGSDDRDIAARVLHAVRHRRAVTSLVGHLRLEELPSLMARCALFVGNNSGPHHLAAGLGVPTIGVHSGVVDAREWGPVGPFAIALQRDMECGPCHLAGPDHCPRALACLTGLRPGDVYRACRKLLAFGHGDRPSRPSPAGSPASAAVGSDCERVG